MKKRIFLQALLACLLSHAQHLAAQEKGVSPLSSAVNSTFGNTYAVVIGISNYQDEGIPDLLFADRDAEAFANFLRSPAGGSLDGDHLRELTNEQATAGNVSAALYWLLFFTNLNHIPNEINYLAFHPHGLHMGCVAGPANRYRNRYRR